MSQKEQQKLGIIATAEDGNFYLLPPVKPGDVTPVVRFFRFKLIPSYIIPKTLTGIRSQVLVKPANVKPVAGVEKFQNDGEHRELACIHAALVLMNTVWKEVARSTRAASPAERWEDAQDFVNSPRRAARLLAGCRNQDIPGFPQTIDGYFRSLWALIYWPYLYDLRTDTKLRGMDWPSAAARLNIEIRLAFPKWDEMGFAGYTARSLRAIITERFGQSTRISGR